MYSYNESLRFAVLSFGVIFVLTGAALITIGTIYHLSFTDLYPVLPDSYRHLQVIPKLIIAVGALNFFFSFVGCVGVFTNNRFLLRTFAVIITIICIIQFSTAIFIIVQDSNDISRSLDATIPTVLNNGSHDFIVLLQSELKCCGSEGPNFWNGTMDMPVPISCCKDDGCSHIYQNGCHGAIVDFLLQAMRVMGASLFVVNAAQVAGAVLAVVLTMGVMTKPKGYQEAEFDD